MHAGEFAGHDARDPKQDACAEHFHGGGHQRTARQLDVTSKDGSDRPAKGGGQRQGGTEQVDVAGPGGPDQEGYARKSE